MMDVIIQQCRPFKHKCLFWVIWRIERCSYFEHVFATQCSFWFTIKLVVILCSYYVIRSSRNEWKKLKFINFNKSYNDFMSGSHAISVIQKYIEKLTHKTTLQIFCTATLQKTTKYIGLQVLEKTKHIPQWFCITTIQVLKNFCTMVLQSA